MHNERAIYNALDWLGDVGGLYEGLKLVAFAFMSFTSGINYTGTLLTKLFFQQDSTSATHKRKNESMTLKEVCIEADQDISRRKNFEVSFLTDLFNSIFCCCRRNSARRKKFNQGEKRAEEQLDIVTLLKNQIMFKLFLKHKTSRLERHYMQ